MANENVLELVYPDPERMVMDALGPIELFGTRTTDVYIDLAGGGLLFCVRWNMHC